MTTTPLSFAYHPPLFFVNSDIAGRFGVGTTEKVHGFPEQEPFWTFHAHDYIHKIALEYLKASTRAQRFNYRRRLKEVAETHEHLASKVQETLEGVMNY